MQLKAVLFDLDDTLYHGFYPGDAEGFARCGAFAAEQIGIPAETFVDAMYQSRTNLRNRLPDEPEMHDRVLFTQGALELLGVNPIPYAEKLHDIYWQGVFDCISVREGVPELLTDLRAHGIRVVLCTNMLANVQMQKLRLLDLADKVDFLVTSEEAGKDKPYAPIFELALQKAGCTAQEAIMVGDSFSHDIRGAHGVGIPGLWLHVHDEPPASADFPFAEFPSFLDAAAYIRQHFLSL